MFLPGNRGFDEYLGVPYSDDMGGARATPCPPFNDKKSTNTKTKTKTTSSSSSYQKQAWFEDYCAAGFCEDKLKEQQRRLHLNNGVKKVCHHSTDPAGCFLPLVYQNRLGNGILNTTVLEQPLDFTHLAEKYTNFITNFINRHAADPFFLYVPFSHVHTTDPLQPEEQYAGCNFKNTTNRGSFGDALHEVDWIIGNLIKTLKNNNLTNNTLILFTGEFCVSKNDCLNYHEIFIRLYSSHSYIYEPFSWNSFFFYFFGTTQVIMVHGWSKENQVDRQDYYMDVKLVIGMLGKGVHGKVEYMKLLLLIGQVQLHHKQKVMKLQVH